MTTMNIFQKKSKSKPKTNIELVINAQKGHAPHRSGSGEHQDKRTKRNRTRQKQRRISNEEEV